MRIKCPYCGEVIETTQEVVIGQHVVCPVCNRKFSYGEEKEWRSTKKMERPQREDSKVKGVEFKGKPECWSLSFALGAFAVSLTVSACCPVFLAPLLIGLAAMLLALSIGRMYFEYPYYGERLGVVIVFLFIAAILLSIAGGEVRSTLGDVSKILHL